MKKDEKMNLGNCPLCNRVMYKGPSVDEHHFTPKCKGGKEKDYVHKTCHRFIHAQFSESELAKLYDTPEKLLQVDVIKNYVKWLQKKDPEFIDKIKQGNRKK